MLITKIEEGKGKKYRVFSEDGYLFSLYGKELKKYHIQENLMIDDAIISSILDEIIYKRGKERALYLLERRPLTEFMLRDKLKKSEYPVVVINRIVSFLYEYHYLDDLEYIRMYVNTYQYKKSLKQIKLDLRCKGITKENLEQFFYEYDYSDEESFQRQFDKYIRNKDLSDYKTKQKVFRYFYGKGFETSMIEYAIREANIS